MMDTGKNRTADDVIRHFENISAIPRISGNTAQIAEYLISFAQKSGLEYVRDGADNVIIKKPATRGLEDRPTVILQGHTDMVAAGSSERVEAMKRNGVTLIREGDILRADGTTLGADNGIAVAYALAVLESDSIPHPALECLFTSNEEIGLIGAGALDAGSLSGKLLINIDGGGENTFTVGCAGGMRVDISQPIRREKFCGEYYALTVSGLLGGHSGIDIHKPRINANKAIGECLSALGDIRLVSLSGGLADNAIPAEASAVFISKQSPEEMAETVRSLEEKFKKTEGSATVELISSEASGKALDASSTQSVLSLISAMPCGVIAMNEKIADLVETSANVGCLRLAEDCFKLTASIRSSIDNSKHAVLSDIIKIAEKHNSTVSTRGEYPGWAYREISPLRDLFVAEFERLFGKAPIVTMIHAGLECGILASKIEGLDCISIGPDTSNVHSAEESLSLPSAERVWRLLLSVLEKI